MAGERLEDLVPASGASAARLLCRSVNRPGLPLALAELTGEGEHSSDDV
jgi:hypothetical protein